MNMNATGNMKDQAPRLSRRRTFVQLPDQLIIDQRVPDFAVRLYARLDRYAGRDGAAFPRIELLASDLSVSVSTVDRALRALVGTGWVRRVRRGFANLVDTELMDYPLLSADADCALAAERFDGVSQSDSDVYAGQAAALADSTGLSTGPTRHADAQSASVDNSDAQSASRQSIGDLPAGLPPAVIHNEQTCIEANPQVTTETSDLTFPETSNLTFPSKETFLKDKNLGVLGLRSDPRAYAYEREAPAVPSMPPIAGHRQSPQEIHHQDQQQQQPQRRQWREPSVHDLPEIVSPWCRTHADDPSPRPCAACAAARAASDASRRARSDAIDRARSAALRSSMAQAEREAVQVPAGALRGMVHAQIAVRRALSAPPDGMSEWM